MKCLMKYQWVKLPREHLPPGKGIMGRWAKLAAHAAFRKGKASYCGYSNDVSPGMCIKIAGNSIVVADSPQFRIVGRNDFQICESQKRFTADRHRCV